MPNSKILERQLKLDEHGYIITDRRQHTNIEGVFAGGDVQGPIFRQAITAAGTGCAAATLLVSRLISGLDRERCGLGRTVNSLPSIRACIHTIRYPA